MSDFKISNVKVSIPIVNEVLACLPVQKQILNINKSGSRLLIESFAHGKDRYEWYLVPVSGWLWCGERGYLERKLRILVCSDNVHTITVRRHNYFPLNDWNCLSASIYVSPRGGYTILAYQDKLLGVEPFGIARNFNYPPSGKMLSWLSPPSRNLIDIPVFHLPNNLEATRRKELLEVTEKEKQEDIPLLALRIPTI